MRCRARVHRPLPPQSRKRGGSSGKLRSSRTFPDSRGTAAGSVERDAWPVPATSLNDRARCPACRALVWITGARGIINQLIPAGTRAARRFRLSQIKSPLTPTLSPGSAGGEGAKARRGRIGVPGFEVRGFGSRSRYAVAHRVRARMARCSIRGPCAAVSRGRQAAQRETTGRSIPFRTGRRRHGCRSQNNAGAVVGARSKSPAPTHGLAGHGEGMDARVEATQERLPEARQAPSGVAFSFTPGILPYALRAGFAVRTAPAAQWLLFSWPRKRKVTRPPQEDESSSLRHLVVPRNHPSTSLRSGRTVSGWVVVSE